jgi:cell division transport system permease protein
LGGSQPLVPAASIAGRALVTVIAIMTFLAALTAGSAQLVAEASSGWRSSVAREVTIQIRPAPGGATSRPISARPLHWPRPHRASPTSASTPRPSPSGCSSLGWERGLNFDELPVPRVVVLRLESGNRPDFAALRKSLAETVRGATLDDHRIWIDRLGVMANTLVVLGIGVTILVLAATGLAVVFATSGAMSGNREIVEVLHFVGASDDYIAREFQRHFLQLGLKGGLIGGACAGHFLHCGRRLVVELRGDARRKPDRGAVRHHRARHRGVHRHRRHRRGGRRCHGGGVTGDSAPDLAGDRLKAVPPACRNACYSCVCRPALIRPAAARAKGEAPRVGSRADRMERLLRLARNLVLTGALLGAVVMGAGFLLFVDMLDRVEGSETRPWMGSWHSPAAPSESRMPSTCWCTDAAAVS